MLTYGTYPIRLYRVWDTHRSVYLAGILGSRNFVWAQFRAYLAKYNLPRTRFRVVTLRISVKDDAGRLVAEVV